jgi:hypothetical protein
LHYGQAQELLQALLVHRSIFIFIEK